MHKIYQPQLLEENCLSQWHASNHFEVKAQGQSYCIMLPPPNITGTLHMGHGLQVSEIDLLIRYHRMLGKTVLWQGGTDHAGIATQMVIERQLESQGKHRKDLSRAEFTKIVSQWQTQSEARINYQLKRLGASIDFSRNRFTQDPEFNQAVVHVFKKLYEDGLIYRGKRLVNWDPILQTAVSDLEVVHCEEAGFLYYVRYALPTTSNYIIVATTRPETLFADVALAVHPEDARYQHLLGQKARVPLCDRVIPIIGDSEVDPKFGTGCVKITPAHDFNDYKLAQRHQLPSINLLTATATLNENAPILYQGLDCIKARRKLVQNLQVCGQLEKQDVYTVKIPRGDRSNAIIEPYLTDQWFIKMQPLAKTAIDAISQEKVKFVPENWKKECLRWLENIEDWCISRQLWWGHRIPAWYSDHGDIWIGDSEEAIRKKYHLNPDMVLHQEEDVLDTWFSSALWPFVTLGWPKDSEDFRKFYPTQVLVTGFDIIFFWVARMLMLGLYCTGQVPFQTVYMTGLIRDHQGQKMSKSKGNVLDPLDIVEGVSLETLIAKRTQGLMQPKMAKTIETLTKQQFPTGIETLGADALRFTYYSLASPSRDIRFDLNRTVGYRNFCNKLWQATRFVSQQNIQIVQSFSLDLDTTSCFDRWILSRLQRLIQTVHQCFETYRFDHLSQALYDFIWHDYCDWYLEFSKPNLKANQNVNASRHVLLITLANLLRLLHPLMPFITEVLWKEIRPLLAATEFDNAIEDAYPKTRTEWIDLKSEKTVFWLQEIVGAIREFKNRLHLESHKNIELLFYTLDSELYKQIVCYREIVESLTKVKLRDASSIKRETLSDAQRSAMIKLGSLELYLPLAETTYVKHEIQRLIKLQVKFTKDLEYVIHRLNNPHFVQKAPSAMVEKLKSQLQSTKEDLSNVEAQLEKLTK